VGRQVFPGVDPPVGFVVDEQHALENAVLAHQVFGRGDLFLFHLIALSFARKKGQEKLHTKVGNRVSPVQRIIKPILCGTETYGLS
jgi:hypothetical protein